MAQGVYAGRVTDIITADPVSNAEVRVINHTDSIESFQITNANGQFEFKALKNGLYTVRVFHLAYDPVEVLRKIPFDIFDQFYLEQNPELLEESIVIGTRAQERSPTVFQNISKKELNKVNFGLDLPFMISQTPSTVSTSDAGAGVGYTGLRMRGIDATRINVTINGFPYNDAESQGVYWVNMPDLASSISSIQIQRGVGTSTNGSAAFGGSINIKTDHVNENPFSRIDLGYGSYNSIRSSIQFGTGMLKNGWGFQGRYSVIQSDGYIDRASSDLNSLYLTGKYRKGKNLFKFNIIRGHERTYQAWFGIPQRYYENGNTDIEFINSWAPSQEVANNMLSSDSKSFNYYTYDNQVDNYDQNHYQAFYSREIKPNTILNFGLNYTRGLGYYEEYHDDENYFDNSNLKYYGLNNIIFGNDTVKNSDIIRRLWLDNHFVGTIFNISHRTSRIHVMLGGGLHQYRGLHYGGVVWSRFASNSEINHRFYKNNALKQQGNIYLKLDNDPLQGNWNLMADLQVRFVVYEFKGPDRSGVITDRQENYVFFNPKIGTSYKTGQNGLTYLTLAKSNREPVRNDFINSSPGSLPNPESLVDMECGYRIRTSKFQINANLFYMIYKDQLVQTGEINDVGEATRQNVKRSFRRGIEADGSYGLIRNKLIVGGNIALSDNRISAFTEYIDNFDDYSKESYSWENTQIAFSPALISSVFAEYILVQNIRININSKYVGRQYLDNTGTKDRSLAPFHVINFRADYQKNFKNNTGIQIGIMVNNLLGDTYVANGYTFPYIMNGIRVTDNYVYPQAPMNYMLRTAITF